LRIDGKSAELFGCSTSLLELHYVQKLRGRREILEGGEDDNDDDDGEEEEEEGGGEATSLLPARIIIKNAIMALPHDVRFRLRFVEACGMFPPGRGPLEEYVMGGDWTRFRQERRGVGRQDFVRGGAMEGRQVRREQASGERRRGIFGRRSTRMAREKITTTGRKTTRRATERANRRRRREWRCRGGVVPKAR
jgi:hypothetical protein